MIQWFRNTFSIIGVFFEWYAKKLSIPSWVAGFHVCYLYFGGIALLAKWLSTYTRLDRAIGFIGLAGYAVAAIMFFACGLAYYPRMKSGQQLTFIGAVLFYLIITLFTGGVLHIFWKIAFP